MQALKHFFIAVQFFTRIPVVGRLAAWVGYSPDMLRASAVYFPLVGWVVAAVSGAVMWFVYATLPALSATPWAAVLLSTAAGIFLTGAFHEDGLADTADGLGTGFPPERVLLIMKDSRIGTYGALSLFLVVLTKVALLVVWVQLSLTWALCVLLMAHTVSRFFPLCVIKALRHVGDAPTSKSKPLASQISWRGLCMALVWCVPPFIGSLSWFPGLVMVGGVSFSALCAVYMAWRLRVRIQGFTGDGLGAVQQLSEIGFYLGALWVAGLRGW